MCRIMVTTTRYSICPDTCTDVKERTDPTGCPEFKKTGVHCANCPSVHLAQTKSKQQCEKHRSSQYAGVRGRRTGTAARLVWVQGTTVPEEAEEDVLEQQTQVQEQPAHQCEKNESSE